MFYIFRSANASLRAQDGNPIGKRTMHFQKYTIIVIQSWDKIQNPPFQTLYVKPSAN